MKSQHEQCKLERKTKNREQKDTENDRENRVIFKDVHEPAETDRKLKEKEFKALLARDEELDGLFERIYEDNVYDKLSDDSFAKMSSQYEDE